MIFEKQAVFKPRVFAKFNEAVNACIYHKFYLLISQLIYICKMPGGFYYYLMNAERIHHVIHTYAAPLYIPFYIKLLLYTRDDPYVPARGIFIRTRLSDGKDFRKSAFFISFTKGAQALFFLGMIYFEIARPFRPLNRDYNPSAYYR